MRRSASSPAFAAEQEHLAVAVARRAHQRLRGAQRRYEPVPAGRAPRAVRTLLGQQERDPLRMTAEPGGQRDQPPCLVHRRGDLAPRRHHEARDQLGGTPGDVGAHAAPEAQKSDSP
ncbi:hypothetical protein ACFSTC_17540 [Nonomuraea ferruginea]